jgi:hypothetical protein
MSVRNKNEISRILGPASKVKAEGLGVTKLTAGPSAETDPASLLSLK